MALIRVTSPHLTGPNHTGRVMRQVMLATLPGVAAQTWFFGWGNLIQILLAATLALFFEGIVLKLRGRPVRFYLNDGSAALTGALHCHPLRLGGSPQPVHSLPSSLPSNSMAGWDRIPSTRPWLPTHCCWSPSRST